MTTSPARPGPLALVGARGFTPGGADDEALLAASGGDEVLVLPTAAAYEHPGRLVEEAAAWFAGFGARVRSLDVLRRADALDEATAAEVRASRFAYLPGGSPMHLRSVLKDSPVWDALVAAWHDGAVVAGSSAGAMVLTDPMVDSRGGAFTVGLGLVHPLAVVPQADDWSEERHRRTRGMAPAGLPLVAVDERAALVRDPDGTWRAVGAGAVRVWVDGVERDLEALAVVEVAPPPAD